MDVVVDGRYSRSIGGERWLIVEVGIANRVYDPPLLINESQLMRHRGRRKRECEPFTIGADSRQAVRAAGSRCKDRGRRPEEAPLRSRAEGCTGSDVHFHDSKIGGQVIELLTTLIPGNH